MIVYHWCLSDSKCLQVSRSLLLLLLLLYTFRVFHTSISWWFFTEVWVTASLLKSPGLFSVFWPSSIMLSFGWSPLVRQLTKSSRPFNNPLVTVPKAPITIGTIVTFMFHSFFQFSCKVEVFILLSTFFQFYSVVSRDSKVDNLQILFFFFLVIIIRSGLLAEFRGSVCLSKCHRSLCVSFSRTDAGLCIYHLFVWSNLNFLCIFQLITLPTQSCLVLSLSVLICCIRLLCDWWFYLCHCIAYICYFVESYLSSLWYGWFLWRCFMLLLGEILFLS